MKTKAKVLALVFLGFTMNLHAADQPETSLSAETSSFGPYHWNTAESYWDRIVQEQRSRPEVRIGESDYVFSGPVVEAFHREKLPENTSRLRRFTALPVVRLFVPQKMPKPPGGTGRYFAWRDSERSWSVTAALPAGPSGAWSNGAFR